MILLLYLSINLKDRDMIADLKLGATYKVVTPYCVYSALALNAIRDTELEFTDINSEDCDCVIISAKHINAITKY